MNFSAMIQTTGHYLNDPRQTRFQRPVISRLLNQSQEEVKRIAEQADNTLFSAIKEYAVVTAEDALEFNLPTDFSKSQAVERIGGTYPVAAIPVNFSSRSPISDDRFLPTGWREVPQYYLRGNKLGIVRPQEAYTLRLTYSKELADLAADSDESEVPKDYHDLICLYAAKRGYGGLGREFPQDLESLRVEGIAQMQNYLDDRDRTGPTYVNVMD